MLTTLKISLGGALIAGVVKAGGPVEQLIALAAGVAALIYLARTLRAGARRVFDLVDTALHGWQKLDDLPSRDQLDRIADFAETSEGRLSNLERQTGELAVHAGENTERLKALTRELDVSVRESERRGTDRRASDRRTRPRPA